jgi:hypothetical protein
MPFHGVAHFGVGKALHMSQIEEENVEIDNYIEIFFVVMP